MKDISEAIIKTVDDWWDRWHRFADEDDTAPEHIMVLINQVETDRHLTFNIMTGMWKDIK